MTEKVGSPNIAEIGQQESNRLVGVLGEREANGYNSVGWEGTSDELRARIGNNSLCPASAFAVVAEGLARYRRQEPSLREDINFLRDFAQALSSGAEIFGEAFKIDKPTLLNQIRGYVNSHDGSFDESINWEDFIRVQARRLNERADRFEAVS